MPSASQSGGRGGTQPRPVNAPAAPTSTAVTPGVPPVTRVTQIIVTPGGVLEGIFTYSTNPPAAGSLIESASVATAGADAWGNNYLAGHASYSAGYATSLDAGYVAFWSGSLAGGWQQQATVQTDSDGDLLLSCNGTIELAGNVTVSGNLTVDGDFSASGDTGTGLPAGTPTGGPNGSEFAGHTHDFDGHTHALS
jgi:hypothetical protein